MSFVRLSCKLPWQYQFSAASYAACLQTASGVRESYVTVSVRTCVCVRGGGRDASPQVLVRLEPGELFGEISFLDTSDAGAAATVRAEDDVRPPPPPTP